MNPNTNRFEALSSSVLDNIKTVPERGFLDKGALLRPDGTEVPKHWTQFQVGEAVVIKDYTFRVAYIGETSILFEPLGQASVVEKPTLAELEAKLKAFTHK